MGWGLLSALHYKLSVAHRGKSPALRFGVALLRSLGLGFRDQGLRLRVTPKGPGT